MASLASRINDLTVAIRNKMNLMSPRLLPVGGSIGQFIQKTGAGDGAAGWANATNSDWVRVGLAADFVNATVTFNDVTGFTCTIPANTNFTIEVELLLVAGNAATNLPRFGFIWSAALAQAAGFVAYDSSTSAEVMLRGLGLTAAGNLQVAAGTAPGVTPYAGRAFLKGRTGVAAVTIKLQLAAETAAANAAQIKAGSEFRYRTGP